MDKLDKILTEHRSDFEEEPEEGHFDRFRVKLRLPESKFKGSFFSPFLKIASVLVIILLSTNIYLSIRNSKPEIKETDSVVSDLNEASFYYTNKINSGIQDLEKLAKDGIGSRQEILQIRHELSEMDSLFVNLQQESKTNPNDERIINAMIEYYQTKLDIVNTIKTDLENVKQFKLKNHENTEI
jgi:hypothetical protein